MEYTKVKTDAFSTLQMNAGILVKTFTPATGAIGDILGATTGGLSFASNPSYEDFGEDVDNCPNNTKQLKRITYYDPVISGTFISLDADLAKSLAGSADLSETIKITPNGQLKDADFEDVWIVGDYSDKNENGTGTAKAGFIAIHLMDALNTAGFQWTTTKGGKGQFAFEYHGHYDLENIDTVPFEIYVKAGTAAS